MRYPASHQGVIRCIISYMRSNTQFADMLHVLVHLCGSAAPLTSDQIGEMLRTNGSVVRRTMSGLRKAGFVESEKGHGGGWKLLADPEKTTLEDVYKALGQAPLFALGFRNKFPSCLAEQAVQSSLIAEFELATTLLRMRFQKITLRTLADDFNHRLSRS